MTERPRNDPLLTVTEWLLRIGIALIALTILVALGAVLALLLFPDQQLAPRLSAPGTMGWVIAAVAISVVMLALYLRFVQLLARIVATVRTGDPFQPENADRLDRMAWLTLAVQGCLLVLAPLVSVIASRISEIRSNFDVSFDGLVMALVLSILARVFRRGTQMRDDLEGTV